MQRTDVAPQATDDSTIEVATAPSAPASARGPDVPRWLRVVAYGFAAGFLAFGACGLLLLVLGVYSAPAAFVLGAAAWVGLLVLARPVLGPALAPVGRSAQAAAVVGVLAICAITAWNSAHASQHVLINRDGGAYTNEGRWIARTGELDAKAKIGPFANEPSLRFDSYAVYPMRNGTIQFQFAHMVPVVLAQAYTLAGDRGLFHAPELLSGIALLAFFVLAWRLFRRPWFALAAVLTLAFLIPEVSFARDSYSEIPSQILLFTALWLLTSDRARFRWPVAFAAGLFVGALEATRIDAIVFLLGIPPLLAVLWLTNRHTPEGRRYALSRGGAFVAGIAPGMTLGLVDLMHHSGRYYNDLSGNVHQLWTAAFASLVVSAIVVAGWSWLARGLRRLPRPGAALAAGGLVTITGFAAWALRPHLQTLHGDPIGLTQGLQMAEHQALDATRAYYEYSLTWMKWYLGPLTLAAALIGAGVLATGLLLGRARRYVAAAALLAPASLLYLWKANAVPDQVWVTRRFLVSAFPTLVLLGLGFAAFLYGRRGDRGWATAARVVAIVLAVGAVVYPVAVLRNVRNMSEQRGYLHVIDDVCNAMGPHPAVVVLERDTSDLIDDWTPMALRGWCGADVAVMRGTPDSAALTRLAKAWQAEGRDLYVVSAGPDVIQRALPDATVVPTREITNRYFLGRTLTHRPDRYVPESLQMAVARVPTGI